jgi:hypothetical protein
LFNEKYYLFLTFSDLLPTVFSVKCRDKDDNLIHLKNYIFKKNYKRGVYAGKSSFWANMIMALPMNPGIHKFLEFEVMRERKKL